jgi:quercetin dioxygenase-like cupin family protein
LRKETLEVPIIRNSEVEFTPGRADNYKRRQMVNKDRGAASVTLGEVIMNLGAELPLHTHQVEEVMVITRGTATAVLGDNTYNLNSGDVILAPAGVPHMLANNKKEPMGFLFFYPAVEVQLYSATDSQPLAKLENPKPTTKN